MAMFVELNAKTKMSIVGLGTRKSPPGKVKEPVKVAIDAGYHHIDCVYNYQNNNEEGEPIQEKVVKQEDLFISSKLWPTVFERTLMKEGCQKTLKDLKLDDVDICLIHWSQGFQPGKDVFPKDNKGNILTTKVTCLDSWEAMEELLGEGLMKAIGISNFNHFQIERLLTKPGLKYKLVTNQTECHPYLTQEERIEYSHSRASLSELTTLWGLQRDLGPSQRTLLYWKFPTLRRFLQSTHTHTHTHKNTTQVLIRFYIQRNVVAILKSVRLTCIFENFQTFDFKLNDEEMVTILSFNRNGRACTVDCMSHLEDYPFNAEY